MINLEKNTIEVNGVSVVYSAQTCRGYRWFTNVGRSGKKIDFKTPEQALRAAAKSLGLKT